MAICSVIDLCLRRSPMSKTHSMRDFLNLRVRARDYFEISDFDLKCSGKEHVIRCSSFFKKCQCSSIGISVWQSKLGSLIAETTFFDWRLRREQLTVLPHGFESRYAAHCRHVKTFQNLWACKWGQDSSFCRPNAALADFFSLFDDIGLSSLNNYTSDLISKTSC